MHIEKMTMRAIVKYLRGRLLQRYKVDDAKLNDLDKILGAVEAEVKAATSVHTKAITHGTAAKRSHKKKPPADSQPSAPASG